MRRPRLGVRLEMFVAGIVVLLVVAAYHFEPWLSLDRGVVAATPVGFPLTGAEVPIPPGDSACMDPVGMTPRAERALVAAAGGVPVRISFTGPSYRASAVLRDYRDGEAKSLPIEPPPRDLLAKVCFANEGDAPVRMVGTTDARGHSLLTKTTVEGTPVEPDITLRFDEEGRETVVAQASDGFEWLSLWKPGVFGPWLLWTLAALIAVAVPVLVVGAFARSVDPDED